MNQDGLYHISLMGGQARAILIESTQLVQRAKDIHGLSRIAAAALGRTLTCAAMMGSMLKGEDESITTQIKGGGPIGTVMAVAHGDCTVKGYVDNPGIDLPRTGPKLPVGAAVGKDGRLTVVKDMHLREPYVGQVNLVSGEIAEDFAMYYLESEQTPSLCALGTLVGENIIASGGILIQAMPDCSEELLDALEIRAELFSSISQLLSEMTLEEIVEGCFRGLNPEILEVMPLRLQCDCSRDYIERVLLSMGEDEIRDMIEKQNGCEVECHFCRKHYRFSGEELEDLLAQAYRANKQDND